MPKITLIIGESGSGKSTKAVEMLNEAHANGRKCIRVSRDGLRRMLYGEESSWNVRLNRGNEKFTQQMEKNVAYDALDAGFDVIVDDINLSENTQNRWKIAVLGKGYEFETVRMNTSFLTCVMRDSKRTGREKVGRVVIEKQFVDSGRSTLMDRPTVLVDVDGTLADSDGLRSPYDESRVIFDKPYPVIVKWVQELTKGHQIVIVSGRHSTCGEETIEWLDINDVPFHHIFMRNGGDNRPDTIIKKEILDGILKYVSKENIKFVLDDRPSVITMWRSNGLRVFPVRGAVDPF